MHKIFALALLSALTFAAADDAAFMDFAAKNNTNYRSAAEMTSRKSNWKAATWVVAGLNASGSTATYDVNGTADMTDAEFTKMLGVPDSTQPRNLEE